MSETLKKSVQAAVLRLLDPLIKLLLAVGIGVGDFLALVKVAYVRAARDQGRALHGELRPNASRIAVVTGLTRAEVAAALADDRDELRTSDRGRQRAERVLTGWWNDPDYQTEAGAPAVLPLQGVKRSFASLVARYSNEPRSAPILDELLRVRAVRKLKDGTVQAISRTVATVRWDPRGMAALGEQVSEHLATVLHNLEHPGQPRYVRRVVNAQLDPRYRPILVRDIEEQVDLVADSIDEALNDPQHAAKGAPDERQAVRLGVAIYLFEEPVTSEADAPPSTPPAAGRTRPPRRQKRRHRTALKPRE